MKNNPIKCKLNLKGYYYCTSCSYEELCLKIHKLRKKASKFGTEGAYEAFVELVEIYDKLKIELGKWLK